MSIAQTLLELVSEESQHHGLKQVKVIKLQVGTLAAVVPEALNFCFELLSRDTIASGGTLDIETVPAVARCPECQMLFEVENLVFLCPQCGGPTMDLVSGRELTLVSIEGEEAGDENGTN
jgi:hydrogenase nickel incorporation protein HypA/HybF